MTTDVLFRGKSIESGNWVYGYFAKGSLYSNGKEKAIIIPTDATLFPRGEISYEEVDAGTVGQYIGREDQNGKKIFEGDLLRERYEFDREYSALYLIVYKNSSYHYMTESGDCRPINDSDLGIDLEDCVVVGNLWDTPNLCWRKEDSGDEKTCCNDKADETDTVDLDFDYSGFEDKFFMQAGNGLKGWRKYYFRFQDNTGVVVMKSSDTNGCWTVRHCQYVGDHEDPYEDEVVLTGTGWSFYTEERVKNLFLS